MEKCAFDWIYRNFILIICLALVVFTNDESQQYSYECNENGDITLLGLLQNSQVTIKEVVYKNESSVFPNCTFTADQYGHVIINRSCTNDSTELRFKVVVVGILEDDSVSSTTASSSQTSISSILSPALSKNTSISSVMSPSTQDTLVSSSTPTMFTSSTNSLPTTTSSPSSSTLLTLFTTASTTPTSLTAQGSTLTTQPTTRTTSTKTTITTSTKTTTSSTTTTAMSTTQPLTTKSSTPTTTQRTTPSTTQTTPKPTTFTTTKPTTIKLTTTTKPTTTTPSSTTPTPPPPTPTTPSTIPTTTTSNTTIPTLLKFRKKRAVKYTNQTFMLTCQQYKNGVIHNILGQLINRDTISLNPVFNSVGKVEMQFKSYRAETEDALKYLPNVSTVYLGDKFFMFLKYIGQQDYKIVPQSCSAYNGGVAVTNSVKPNVPLWSYDRCVSDIARKYHLMHGFEKINDKIIFAELFGFHFVDDADISVECDVMICNKAENSPMCTLEQNDCGRTKFNRRTKRTTNKYIKVVKRLKVMNRRQQYTENTAMKHRQNSLMVLIVAVVYGGDYILP